LIDTILFDLGNTLVRYYGPHEFAAVLERSLGAARDSLRDGGYAAESFDVIRERAAAENYETPDDRTRSLEGRLARIFSIDAADQDLLARTARDFMAPIFEMGTIYADTLPALESLRRQGYKIGIVSNSPWGCPAELLHAELERHRLTGLVDAAIFCVEIGWRKPAPQIFHHALERMGAEAGRTLFVGDDRRWDVEGPQRIGMRAALLDRKGRVIDAGVPSIRSLDEIHSLVAGWREPV
jgi:putative hydrolase of the HAD superfamily